MYMTCNLPPANEVCEGCVFTPVCQSFCSHVGVHGEGGMRGEGGRGGACVAGKERWPLQLAVCILLECILVSNWILKNIIPEITLPPWADFLSCYILQIDQPQGMIHNFWQSISSRFGDKRCFFCTWGRVWVHHLSLSSGHRQNRDGQWLSCPIPWSIKTVNSVYPEFIWSTHRHSFTYVNK